MSNKQIDQDLLERVPDDASLHDIAREIEFVAAIRQGTANWIAARARPLR